MNDIIRSATGDVDLAHEGQSWGMLGYGIIDFDDSGRGLWWQTT